MPTRADTLSRRSLSHTYGDQHANGNANANANSDRDANTDGDIGKRRRQRR